MKSTFKTTTILASASLAAVLMIAAAFQAPTPAQASVQTSEVASVTVVAKRMSAEQKLAYDLETQTAKVADAVHTVVISSKRLSAEQKLAMDREDKAMQTVVVRQLAQAKNNG